MSNESRRRSIACFLFAVIGLIIFAVAVAVADVVSVLLFIIIIAFGIGLCVGGLTYAILSNREYKLIGIGITSVILSIFGVLYGLSALVIATVELMMK